MHVIRIIFITLVCAHMKTYTAAITRVMYIIHALITYIGNVPIVLAYIHL